MLLLHRRGGNLLLRARAPTTRPADHHVADHVDDAETAARPLLLHPPAPETYCGAAVKPSTAEAHQRGGQNLGGLIKDCEPAA